MAINNNINDTSDVFYSIATGDDSSCNLKFSGNSIWNPTHIINFVPRKNASQVYIEDDAGGSVLEFEMSATSGAINIDAAPKSSSTSASGQFQTRVAGKIFSIYGVWWDNYVQLTGTGGGKIKFSNCAVVTLPLEPCFCATNSAADLNQTGNGTLVTVDVDTERFDLNSDFASDTFTASVDGKYFLQGAVTLKGATSANSMHLEIVTTNRTYYGADCSPSAIKDTINNDVLLNISTYCDMEKTETAVLKIIANGEGSDSLTINGNATYPITYFSGFLAC